MKTYARFFAAFSVSAVMLAGATVNPAMAQEKAKAGTQAATATLDAKAARSLISDRVWQIKKKNAAGHDYWSWKSDGSVCVRLSEKTGKCADTGRWKLDGERLCYELTWLGVTWGMKSACFRISDRGKGRYEGLQDNGFTLFEFTIST
jgi:hypothetical protein